MGLSLTTKIYVRECHMKSLVKITMLLAVVATLSACTGRIENRDKTCSYDYLLHPAISISKVIGGCGPAAPQK
jgi:hypothetical protein